MFEGVVKDRLPYSKLASARDSYLSKARPSELTLEKTTWEHRVTGLAGLECPIKDCAAGAEDTETGD